MMDGPWKDCQEPVWRTSLRQTLPARPVPVSQFCTPVFLVLHPSLVFSSVEAGPRLPAAALIKLTATVGILENPFNVSNSSVHWSLGFFCFFFYRLFIFETERDKA